MFVNRDSKIALRHALVARAFQAAYPILQKAFFADPALELATKPIAIHRTVELETRHGSIDVLIFSPTDDDIAAQLGQGKRPPVHLLTHGGAYITRYPVEEGNVARYLCSEIGCYVVIPDYHAAPQVRFPVAEEECYDTYKWIIATDKDHLWDTLRVSVGGPSAGGSLALAVALMSIDKGEQIPLGVSSEYGVADVGRDNDKRPSAKAMPVVGPWLMDLVKNTYVKDVDWTNGYSSPLFHPRLADLPPTLIITAEYDTLKNESNDLAAKLRASNVQITHHEFAGVDHGFTHQKPVEVARQAIAMIGDHLKAVYAA